MALAGYAWIVLGGTVLMCVMAALGLAYSLYPYIVLDRLTIWQAAALGGLFVLAACIPYLWAYDPWRDTHGQPAHKG